MVKPLTFKGEKPKKRKRVAEQDDPDDSTPSTSKALAPAHTEGQADRDEGEDLSWVTAEGPGDVGGPVLIALPTSPASCIACDANGKVFASELQTAEGDDASAAEPHDVRQVWVANMVAGTECLSFKGHHGKYLGCDKFGIVSATKEAISPEESFVCINVPESAAMFSLQTQRDTFLAADEGKNVASTTIRGDAETISFSTTFRIRMQARFKPRLKASKEEKAREKISRKELEEAIGRRLEDEEVKMLKRARRNGSYHEALLDVKVKGKHDKFA